MLGLLIFANVVQALSAYFFQGVGVFPTIAALFGFKPLVDGYPQARCYGYDAGIHTELAARRLLTLYERQRASFLDRAMFDAALDRKKALDERDRG